MTLDARILLAGRGVEAPDTLGNAQKAMSLAQLARAGQIQQMEMDKVRRAEQAQSAIGEALGGLDMMDDNQVRQALVRMPAEVRPLAYKFIQEQRGKRATEAKDRSAGYENDTKRRIAQHGFVAQIAGAVAQNPTREAILAAEETLARSGLGLPAGILRAPPGMDQVQYLRQLTDSSLSQKERLDAEDKTKQRTLTANRDAETAANHLRVNSRMTEANAAQQAIARARQEQAGATREAGNARGAPQEIVVNGEPVLAIYDNKTGTYFDVNTRQPIRGGIGPKSSVKDAAAASQAQNDFDLVSKTIADARTKLNSASIPATGLVGGVSRNIWGTDSHDLSNLLDTLRAKVGFNELSKMRKASPTGGALGQVTEREIAFLQAAIASLSQTQSEGQFTKALDRVEQAFAEVVHGPAGLRVGKAAKSSVPGAPAIGEERDGWVYKGGPPGSPSSWEKVKQ